MAVGRRESVPNRRAASSLTVENHPRSPKSRLRPVKAPLAPRRGVRRGFLIENGPSGPSRAGREAARLRQGSPATPRRTHGRSLSPTSSPGAAGSSPGYRRGPAQMSARSMCTRREPRDHLAQHLRFAAVLRMGSATQRSMAAWLEERHPPCSPRRISFPIASFRKTRRMPSGTRRSFGRLQTTSSTRMVHSTSRCSGHGVPGSQASTSDLPVSCAAARSKPFAMTPGSTEESRSDETSSPR